MKYTRVQPDFFKKIVLNAGVLLNGAAFNPDTGEYDTKDIIASTMGGLTFNANPTYIDFGADINGMSPDSEQLKRVISYAPSLSGTFANVSAPAAKTLLGAADAGPAHIIPRGSLSNADFADLWLVGDYSDKNKGPTAGYFAILLKNALNSDGLQLQSNKNGKGTLGFTFGGHYDFDNLDDAPFELYAQQSILNLVTTVIPPAKLSYEFGDAFDTTGFAVTLDNGDGNLTDITAECSLSVSDGDLLLTASDNLTVAVIYRKTQIGDFTVSVSGLGEPIASQRFHYPNYLGKWTLYANGYMYVDYDGALPNYYDESPEYPPASGITFPSWRAYAQQIRTVQFSPRITRVGNYACNEYRFNMQIGGYNPYAELSAVYFPTGLLSIGEGAFLNTSLKHVTIPASVRTISRYAFYGTAIREVTVSRNCTVNYYAFPSNCTISYYEDEEAGM